MSRLVRLVATAVVASVPAIAGAQGWIIQRPCIVPPDRMPVVPCRASDVVRTRSDVRVELIGRVLRYEVDERFVNRGPAVGEADYVFPLPKDAAFQDLKLSINGELTAGETMSADEARRIYEEIVRRQRDPALVEWMGYGLLRARIFPINPGEEKRVVVRFQSVVQREGDAWRIDYARGTRPSTPLQRTGDRSAEQSSFELAYAANESLGTPYSPTHELSLSGDADQRRVEARGSGSTVTILIPVRRPDNAAISLLANAPGGEDGFALLTVTPPDDRRRAVTPRDVTFVLDVSGSMSGRKIEQARAAGRQLLATLRPGDRFRMIDFSSDVRTFRDDYVFATSENVRLAGQYLDELDASGGTNIAGALDRALSGRRCAGDEACLRRLGVVLFITDGEPTVGEQDPAAIAAAAKRERGAQRIFTFGLGSDVNAALLEQLALQGGGTAQFVRPEENVERVVGITAGRLVDPVLTDVRVRAEGDVHLTKLLPTQPLDLFAGQDLVLLGRYSGHGSARVVVEGRHGGDDVRWVATADFPEHERGNPFVPRLWATQRIGWLSAEKRMHPAADHKELDDEIRSLGERFGIPTEFSSYLVQEPCNGAAVRCVAVNGHAVPAAAGGLSLNAVTVTGATASRHDAFSAAKRASEQRAALSAVVVDSLAAAAPNSGGERRVADRVFVLRDGRWTDTRWRAGIRIVKVGAYSSSWFAFLQRIPELRDAFALGEQVLVAGRTVALETTSSAPALSADDVNRIVREW